MAAPGASPSTRLGAILGGRRTPRSRALDPERLRVRLRTGLPYGSLLALGEAYAIDLRSLGTILGIPERTLARRRQEKRLRPEESDRLYRVARIATLAEEVLGGKERACRWLRRPNRALGNAAPFDHLDTELGARQVEDVLGRIAHGVHS